VRTSAEIRIDRGCDFDRIAFERPGQRRQPFAAQRGTRHRLGGKSLPLRIE